MFVHSGEEVRRLLKRRIMPICSCQKARSGWLCDYVIVRTRGGGEIKCSRPVCGYCKHSLKLPDGSIVDFCREHAHTMLKACPDIIWTEHWDEAQWKALNARVR